MVVCFFVHKEKKPPSLTLECLERLDLGTDLTHTADCGPNALLLDRAHLSGGKLFPASLSGPSVCCELEVPMPKDEDLDKVKEHKVGEGNTNDGNAPQPSDWLADNDTVDTDQHGKNLGSHDGNKENGRGHVLPEVSRETGRENDEMRRG